MHYKYIICTTIHVWMGCCKMFLTAWPEYHINIKNQLIIKSWFSKWDIRCLSIHCFKGTWIYFVIKVIKRCRIYSRPKKYSGAVCLSEQRMAALHTYCSPCTFPFYVNESEQDEKKKLERFTQCFLCAPNACAPNHLPGLHHPQKIIIFSLSLFEMFKLKKRRSKKTRMQNWEQHLWWLIPVVQACTYRNLIYNTSKTH